MSVKLPQAVAAFLLLMCALANSSANSGQPFALGKVDSYIERSKEGSTLSKRQIAELSEVRARPNVKQAAIASLRTPSKVDEEVSLTLPDGVQAVFKISRRETHGPKTLVLAGYGSDPRSQITLVIHEGVMSGQIMAFGRAFDITGIDARNQLLIEYDLDREPPRHAPPSKPIKKIVWQSQDGYRDFRDGDEIPTRNTFAVNVEAGDAEAAASATSFPISNTLNVLFAFTPKARQILNIPRESAAAFAVDRFNLIMRESGLSYRAQSVGVVDTPYDYDNTYIELALQRSNTADVRRARDVANADVIILFGKFNGCGITNFLAAPKDAIALISSDCTYRYYNIAHEVGHMIGGRHEIGVDSANTPYPDGHGYRYKSPSLLYPGVFHCRQTVMAASIGPRPSSEMCSNNTSLPVDRWSEPVMDPDFAMMGNAATANMKRVVSVAFPKLTTFRHTKIGLGIVERLLRVVDEMFHDD